MRSQRLSRPAVSARRFRWGGTLTLLLAAALRLFNLHDLPPGLSQDEVLNADIVERILAGQHALFFREGFGHEPLYHYYAALFQPLLGDNVLSIRLPAIFLGLIVVALTVAYGRRQFGPLVGLASGLMMALHWWAIVFSRIGLRPIMEPLWLLLAAWHWQRRPLLASFFIALTFYTYTPALVFLGFPFIVAAYQFVLARWRIGPMIGRHITLPQRVQPLVPLLLYLPLFLYLRENPDLLQRGGQLSGPIDALRAGDWRPLWDNLRATIGVFGWTGDPRWSYMLPHKPFFDIGTGLTFALGVLSLTARLRHFRYGFLLIWLLIGLLPSILTPDAPSSIRLIGALPPTFLILAIGCWQIGRWSRSSHIAWGMVLVVGGLIFGRTQTLQLNQWAHAFETRADKFQTIYLDIARHIATEPNQTPVILDSSFAPIDADSVRRNLGAEPHARWAQAGNALVLPPTTATLYVPEYAPLHPTLFAAVGINADAPNARSLRPPYFATYTLPTQTNLAPVREPIVFDNRLVLHGLKIDADDGTVLSEWEVLDMLPPDLSIFLHIVAGADAPPVAQHDGLDAAASTLKAGDRLIQHHFFQPPPDATGQYWVNIGLYRRTSGQRLSIVGDEAQFYTHPTRITFR